MFLNYDNDHKYPTLTSGYEQFLVVTVCYGCGLRPQLITAVSGRELPLTTSGHPE